MSLRFLRRPGFWIGLALAAAVGFLPSGLHEVPERGHRPAVAAAVCVLMAAWWFSEAIPIAVTACAPLVLFPLLGVFGIGSLPDWRAGRGSLLGETAKSFEPFADAYIFLFLGGMLIGAAMEATNLHRRLALRIMCAIGSDPKRLLLGMIVATAFISLWISNTATAVMMVPIARALLARLEESRGGRRLERFGAALMLSVAYASNVGGIGTKIGTATNSIFCGFVANNLGHDITFAEFVAVGLPFVVIFVPLVWGVLWRVGRDDDLPSEAAKETLDRELAAMGRMRREERIVAVVFGLAATAWIASDLLRPWVLDFAKSWIVPSLWNGFQFLGKHYEAWVAMAGGLSMIVLRVLPVRAALRIPWGTLLLLGGSFAMASGIDGSGLGDWLATRLAGIADLPLFAQVAIAVFSSVALTAVASNTATVTVMLGVLPRSLPVLAGTCLASSCDFALPAGTPPNAIVFGSGYVRLPVMMRTGLVLDAAAASIITLYSALYLTLIF